MQKLSSSFPMFFAQPQCCINVVQSFRAIKRNHDLWKFSLITNNPGKLLLELNLEEWNSCSVKQQQCFQRMFYYYAHAILFTIYTFIFFMWCNALLMSFILPTFRSTLWRMLLYTRLNWFHIRWTHKNLEYCKQNTTW